MNLKALETLGQKYKKKPANQMFLKIVLKICYTDQFFCYLWPPEKNTLSFIILQLLFLIWRIAITFILPSEELQPLTRNR